MPIYWDVITISIMKGLLLALLLFGLSEDVTRVYRLTSAIFDINGKSMKLVGTNLISNLGDQFLVGFLGIDLSTMTPYELLALADGGTGEVTATCNNIRYPIGVVKHLSGTFTAKIDDKQMSLKGSCKAGEDVYTFDTVGSRGPTYYTFKEAAAKAQKLVGQETTFWKSPQILYYAIADLPNEAGNCRRFINGEELEKAEPGCLILGKNYEYCAIVDSEGDKFIHGDLTKKKVASTPMAMIKTFFPSGYTFRKYPRIFRIDPDEITE